jgi:hypothetical protein
VQVGKDVLKTVIHHIGHVGKVPPHLGMSQLPSSIYRIDAAQIFKAGGSKERLAGEWLVVLLQRVNLYK